MPSIKASKKDIFWNYIGTAFHYCGSLILIPFMTAFLTSEDLGLWYVFLAIASLAQLFDAGFNPAFARNIVYCLSGARDISSNQRIRAFGDQVDWHLLRTLLKASRVFYAFISLIVLVGVVAIGTPYIWLISDGFSSFERIASWVVFSLAIFLNLFFLYAYSNLLGLGDVAGESQAKTVANIGRLIVTLLMLFAGFGLLAAAVGFLVQGLATRLYALHRLKKHKEIKSGIRTDNKEISFKEVLLVIRKISPIAWRNGAEQLSLFAATQGTSIVCSLAFSLQVTAQYSLALQLSNAIATLSYVLARTYYPSYQFAYAKDDTASQREIIEKSIPIYWLVGLIGAAGVMTVILPVLSQIRATSVPSISLFLTIFVYTILLNHYMVFCNLILSTNRIPFLKSFIISSAAGLVLGAVFLFSFNIGAYGLVIGQAVPQLIYNIWKWPLFVVSELNTTYWQTCKNGFLFWREKLSLLFIRGKRK